MRSCAGASGAVQGAEREDLELCDVPEAGIVTAVDAENIYEIPLVLHDEGFDADVCKTLHLDHPEADLTDWKALVERMRAVKDACASGSSAST